MKCNFDFKKSKCINSKLTTWYNIIISSFGFLSKTVVADGQTTNPWCKSSRTIATGHLWFLPPVGTLFFFWNSFLTIYFCCFFLQPYQVRCGMKVLVYRPPIVLSLLVVAIEWKKKKSMELAYKPFHLYSCIKSTS